MRNNIVMKILSIIAQKPSSTGSGVYLSELVRCFKEMGHEQEVICAVYESDVVGANATAVGAKQCEPVYNKIIFNTKELPIKIAGMSDAMPYESMRYSELASDEKKLSLWINAFDKKVREVVDRFKPDLIICHHLYLLTAMVANIINEGSHSSPVRECVAPTRPLVYGISHNTDLRQYQQTDLKRDFIKNNIKKLDKCFFLSQENADSGIGLFDLDKSKVVIIGIGYNSILFKNNRAGSHCSPLQEWIAPASTGSHSSPLRECVATTDAGSHSSPLRECVAPTKKLLFVGKVCKKKGVLSLVKAINLLNDENIVLDIVGGAGNKDEYDEIVRESKKSKSKINFLPPMTQDKLAIEYNNHDIFILPSFFEGMPLVPLEAMACGCKVVISDLPGVKNFYDANVKNASIRYVELPKLSNVDNASEEELDAFEKRLARAIRESIDDKKDYEPDLSSISWESIARKIVTCGLA